MILRTSITILFVSYFNTFKNLFYLFISNIRVMMSLLRQLESEKYNMRIIQMQKLNVLHPSTT